MSTTESTVSTRPATLLMVATYILGGVGIFVGYTTVGSNPPSLLWASLLAVTGAGGLSFIRHSLFHRSDAARLGWDFGERNNFQIEVGIANLAMALVALLAAIMNWGMAVQAATLLTFGLYLAGSAIMLIVSGSQRRRPWPGIIAMALFGFMQVHLGVLGMATI